ncbi:hypothetical protein KNE206_34120 [Kitasatospora sp. NE20-6]
MVRSGLPGSGNGRGVSGMTLRYGWYGTVGARARVSGTAWGPAAGAAAWAGRRRWRRGTARGRRGARPLGGGVQDIMVTERARSAAARATGFPPGPRGSGHGSVRST